MIHHTPTGLGHPCGSLCECHRGKHYGKRKEWFHHRIVMELSRQGLRRQPKKADPTFHTVESAGQLVDRSDSICNMRISAYLTLSIFAAGLFALAQTPDVSEIRRKVQAGEELTPKERQILQQSNAAGQKKRREEYLKDHTPVSSTGNIALTDLGTGMYKGEQGGLYPGGSNTAPPEHLAAGVKLAKQVKPLDMDGNPSPDGKIVLMSIGFSNPNMEFPVFKKLVEADADHNPKLLLVNGCVGGRESKTIADPNSIYWKELDRLVTNGGTSRKQVQVLWVKQVVANPTQPFPVEAKQLAHDHIATLENLRKFFPNAKLAFLSARTYGGYTEANGSPEPAGPMKTGVRGVEMGHRRAMN